MTQSSVTYRLEQVFLWGQINGGTGRLLPVIDRMARRPSPSAALGALAALALVSACSRSTRASVAVS